MLHMMHICCMCCIYEILLIVFDDIHLLKLQNDDLRSRGYLGALIAPGNEARYP